MPLDQTMIDPNIEPLISLSFDQETAYDKTLTLTCVCLSCLGTPLFSLWISMVTTTLKNVPRYFCFLYSPYRRTDAGFKKGPPQEKDKQVKVVPKEGGRTSWHILWRAKLHCSSEHSKSSAPITLFGCLIHDSGAFWNCVRHRWFLSARKAGIDEEKGARCSVCWSGRATTWIEEEVQNSWTNNVIASFVFSLLWID